MTNKAEVMSTNDPLAHLTGWRRYRFFAQKTLAYLRRYATNPRYLLLYLTNAANPNYREAVKFLADSEFLTAVKQRSTIRLGDGEFGMLMSRRGIHFQNADPKLLSLLSEMVDSYDDRSPYILGLNPQIIMPNRLLERCGLKYLFMSQKLGYRLKLNHQACYCNASYFYLKNTGRSFMADASHGKQVVLVANNEKINGVKTKEAILFPAAHSVTYISVPDKDAFSGLTALLEKIREEANPQTSVIIASAGPAGKALVYILSREGYLGHDLGHGLEFAINDTDGEYLIGWDLLKDYWVNNR